MAITGAGGKLQVTIASVLTDVAGVYSIKGPDITVDAINVSTLQSTNVFKEFISGFGDGGSVTLECRYTAAQFSTLYGLIRATQVWRVLFSDGSKWDFSGLLTAMSTDIPLEEDVTMPMTIKVTGKPTFST